MRARLRSGISASKAAYGRVRTKRARIPGDRLEEAVTAHRSIALAEGLLVFLVAFSVDDLHVLRFPAYLLALGGAFLFMAFAPLLHGRRFAHDHADMEDDLFRVRARTVRRAGTLLALLTSTVALVWFVFFSAGVPPWAV